MKIQKKGSVYSQKQQKQLIDAYTFGICRALVGSLEEAVELAAKLPRPKFGVENGSFWFYGGDELFERATYELKLCKELGETRLTFPTAD